jgi:putative membrane protein
MPAFMAFVHHAAAFALVSALAVELAMLREELDVRRARRLQVADMILGLCAGVLLVVGLLRVFYFEKGAAYYFSNLAFIAKLSLFIAIALLSVYPTLVFLSWRGAIRAGRAPSIEASRLRRVRAVLHLELAGVLGILLCAALMARGIG